ncbi:Mitochondrial import inner membrane translocase subunit tim22 [Physocladia obscura]|uniref:Mitochondrial import inner membrane translocase subunit TIM22 n=1 Tax=Physocladia obscura TaxID=109957 RepID=A0AAD5XGY8_9FUNG|nr:Mitochondrial import inner membrane translocase subunit tim22 [Physocladia obscura]
MSEQQQGDFARGFDAAASGTLDPMAAMAMSQLTESCPFKSVFALGAGFALGGVFGMFMSSMDMSSQAEFEKYGKMSTRDQIKHTFRDMGSRSYSSAKNFAVVGAVFAGTECVIETYRAKNDIYNGISAGCLTGAALAAKAGPYAMGTGCVGFAAFSAAIDYYMRHG